MSLNLPPAQYIRTTAQLQRVVNTLKREPLIGVDTESNSLYAYRERVCLIQISSRQADYIVDPLGDIDVSPLAPLFADANIEKVFHAAEYDVMCLKRDYAFTFANLFDTMIAARICAVKSIGLGALLQDILGVQADKSHQRDNWGERPLEAGSLLYAQMDTHYLPLLRDHFTTRLAELNLWHEAREAFAALANLPPNTPVEDPQAFWRVATPNRLKPRQAAIFRELYLMREQLAQRRDVPPFKILSDKSLIAVARVAPHDTAGLRAIGELPDSLAHRYGEALLEAVTRGQAAPLPAPPNLEPPLDPKVVERYTALREWRKQRAETRGVESDVIIGKDVLWALAETVPVTLDAMRAIRGLTEWRIEQYGEELLGVLGRHP